MASGTRCHSCTEFHFDAFPQFGAALVMVYVIQISRDGDHEREVAIAVDLLTGQPIRSVVISEIELHRLKAIPDDVLPTEELARKAVDHFFRTLPS